MRRICYERIEEFKNGRGWYRLCVFFPFERFVSQYYQVKAGNIIPEKIALINERKSPIQDKHIEKMPCGKGIESDGHLGCKGSLQ